MDPPLLAAIAAALFTFGLVSRTAERSILTPPIVFVLLGFGLGAHGLGWLALDAAVIHGLAELTLVLVLFTDAARIDFRRLRMNVAVPVRMLGVGMPLTIGLGTVVAVLLFDELELWEAFLLAAVLAPTDPKNGKTIKY